MGEQCISYCIFNLDLSIISYQNQPLRAINCRVYLMMTWARFYMNLLLCWLIPAYTSYITVFCRLKDREMTTPEFLTSSCYCWAVCWWSTPLLAWCPCPCVPVQLRNSITPLYYPIPFRVAVSGTDYYGARLIHLNYILAGCSEQNATQKDSYTFLF